MYKPFVLATNYALQELEKFNLEGLEMPCNGLLFRKDDLPCGSGPEATKPDILGLHPEVCSRLYPSSTWKGIALDFEHYHSEKPPLPPSCRSLPVNVPHSEYSYAVEIKRSGKMPSLPKKPYAPMALQKLKEAPPLPLIESEIEFKIAFEGAEAPLSKDLASDAENQMLEATALSDSDTTEPTLKKEL
jgi:hypothetical protein